jgi:hypothetical protein
VQDVVCILKGLFKHAFLLVLIIPLVLALSNF